MATNAGASAGRQLASARVATAVHKKYTVQSTPFWDRIRRFFAIDPNRSTGIPLNPQYRNPPPGAPLPPGAYEDPVTIPASDIAENPYYKRDMRRSYPQVSVVRQADVVGLLTVGSKSKPLEEVLPRGEAGSKMLVEVRKQGEMGVARVFGDREEVLQQVLGDGGMPIFPAALGKGKTWVMDKDREEGYPEEYPCRTFV